MGEVEKLVHGWVMAPAVEARVKEAKSGHWRKVDGRGEDQSGNPIRGKTWVDKKDSGGSSLGLIAGLTAGGILGAMLMRNRFSGQYSDDAFNAARKPRPSGGPGGSSGGGGGPGGSRRPFNDRPNPPKAPRPQQSWHDQQYADDIKHDDEFYDTHGHGRTEDVFWEWMNKNSGTSWGPKARDAKAKARWQARAEGKAWSDSHRQPQEWHDARYKNDLRDDDAFYAKYGKGESEKDFWAKQNKYAWGDNTDFHWGPEARNAQAKKRAEQRARRDEQWKSDNWGRSRSSSGGYGGGSSGGSSSSSDPWDAWRPRSSAAHESVLKSWGVDTAAISKKKEIKKIYQGKAMEMHPDKHPGKEAEFTKKMQDLNAEWEKVEKSSWYEKLAKLRSHVALMRLRSQGR